MVEAFIERSETLGNIPPSDQLAFPPVVPDRVGDNMDKKERLAVKAERERVHSANAKFQGQREALFRKVGMANDLKNQTFWIPHCPDFRGRLYPQSQDLNFVNDDLSRGLIRFAEGKKMGDTGHYWLAVRLANTYGLDKLSFADRVQWVIDNDKRIMDSAINPLDGDRWWSDADEPFQFLAACDEYRGWAERGDDHISHIPINLDATASGLQHLAAWTRDPRAAQVVNMTASNQRYDIYGIQADEVNRIIASQLDDNEAARNCHGHVTRSSVKRGIMTTPYLSLIHI